MAARIYRPAKTAMSSGQGQAQQWRMEFEPERAKTIESPTGYTSSDDMQSQIRLDFDSKEAAIAYAERNGIAYQLFEPKEAVRPAISYSDNFRRDRTQPWTH